MGWSGNPLEPNVARYRAECWIILEKDRKWEKPLASARFKEESRAVPLVLDFSLPHSLLPWRARVICKTSYEGRYISRLFWDYYTVISRISEILETCVVKYLTFEYLWTKSEQTVCSRNPFLLRRKHFCMYWMLFFHLWKEIPCSRAGGGRFQNVRPVLILAWCVVTLAFMTSLKWKISDLLIWVSNSFAEYVSSMAWYWKDPRLAEINTLLLELLTYLLLRQKAEWNYE